MGAKSAQRLSFHSVLLEPLAITSTMTYSIANSFPFSSWSEAAFLMLQTVSIECLVQHFVDHMGHGLLFLFLYFGGLSFLLSPLSLMSVATVLQAFSVLAVTISKLL